MVFAILLQMDSYLVIYIASLKDKANKMQHKIQKNDEIITNGIQRKDAKIEISRQKKYININIIYFIHYIISSMQRNGAKIEISQDEVDKQEHYEKH